VLSRGDIRVIHRIADRPVLNNAMVYIHHLTEVAGAFPVVQLRVQKGVGMKTISFSESRKHYAETLDTVLNDREEVVITRAGRDPVVILALDEYESLKETAYLLQSPANAARILQSIAELEAGGGKRHELFE
jgi:antitoxin YefM